MEGGKELLPRSPLADEAATGWLAETILETLHTSKLQAWPSQVGLSHDIEKLKPEVERIEAVVASAKGRVIQNKPLARCFARLMDIMYEADDVVDEIDYYRLQNQVERHNDSVSGNQYEGMDEDGEEQLDGSGGGGDDDDDDDVPVKINNDRRRSKYWDEFDITDMVNGKPTKAKCIHCERLVKCTSVNGTSVLKNHLHSAACTKKRNASSSRRKRMRTDDGSAQETAANSLEMATLANRIQNLVLELHGVRDDISEFLKYCPASSEKNQSNTPYQCLRTSGLLPQKLYGRDADKDYILRVMTACESDSMTVLPIIGTAGVGKTAVVQAVYNDPAVKSKFERIWISVSVNFDLMTLTREMLDFVCQENPRKGRYEGISSYTKLQEILEGHMQFQSKRFLLVVDDVWDSMDEYRWSNLLAPLRSSNMKGNLVLLTTRYLSVAQRIGSVEQLKLGALVNEDCWSICKTCAFGNENFKGHPSLGIIGQKIAERLHGNPLAAETVGKILRKHLTVDHWSNILKREEWKSLQFHGGIMPALKLSYDQLPYHLQRCFMYCCIFPKNYQFIGDDLVRIWISMGFVRCVSSSKGLEEMGWDCLTDLVNSGFFEQVEGKRSNHGNQTSYMMCGSMHDFARLISKFEFGTVDGLECNEMLPTIRHLSIVTDSAYPQDKDGNICRNEKFEKQLKSSVTSVKKLRTLVLIGKYDSFFFKAFKDIFRKFKYLRLLQISATHADFNSFLHSLASCIHLRYLKLESGRSSEVLHTPLNKCYHLQVLDTCHPVIPIGINDLVNLRHLNVQMEAQSLDGSAMVELAQVDEMSCLQILQEFKYQNPRCFEMTQLQSMNDLVQLSVSHLERVDKADALGAKLRDKEHLEKLCLSWNTFSGDEYDSDGCSEEEISEMDDIRSGRGSECIADIAKEVLEALEPHHNLKHLQISGYGAATSPVWLATPINSLRTLHLEDCGEWQMLPSLERFPFLTKLKLRNMRNIKDVLIPALEELVLIKMPKLERFSCNSISAFNYTITVMHIEDCCALKHFLPLRAVKI